MCVENSNMNDAGEEKSYHILMKLHGCLEQNTHSHAINHR